MCKGSKWAPGCGDCQVNLMRLDPADGRKIWQRYIIGRDQVTKTVGTSLRAFPESDDVVFGYIYPPGDLFISARVIERIRHDGTRLWQGARPNAGGLLNHPYCVDADENIVYRNTAGFHKVDGSGVPIWDSAPDLNVFDNYLGTTLQASGTEIIFGGGHKVGNTAGTGWGKLSATGGIAFQNPGSQAIENTYLLSGYPDALLSNGDWLTIRDSSFILMQLSGSDGEPVNYLRAGEVSANRKGVAAKNGRIYLLTMPASNVVNVSCYDEGNFSSPLWNAGVWTGNRVGNAIAVGSDGVYVVGKGTFDGEDVHVAKLSLVDGSLIWTTWMGDAPFGEILGQCYDVCVSPSGFVYVAGDRMRRRQN